ncbi:MAG TPA: hypothetical protein DCM86_01165 [Verrucomicrobiales bacterium]|nr:hypothetical protein [Verrucomicrobiales bacterium]
MSTQSLRQPQRWSPPLGGPRVSARQRVLAQWRGLNTSPEEVARRPSARAVSDVLPRVLKEIRYESRQAEAEIVKVWNASVDPTVAAHAQPTGIHKGTLFVNVDSNVWLSEIVRWYRRDIIKRLQAALGPTVVQKISFRVGG